MSAIDGDWYEAGSSRRRRVRVSQAGQGMLRFEADDRDERVAAADIAVSARLGRTPRVMRLPDGSRVEVPDSPLVDAWLPSRGNRVEAWADWLERRRSAILVAALVTVGVVVLFFRAGVPAMAHYIAGQLPRGVEVAASDQAMVLLRRMGMKPSGIAPERRERLQRRFRELVADEPRRDELALDFVDARAFGANAFALPDGRIFMTDALLELSDDDDELLAVLAHEAGHHAHRHGMRQAIESSSVVVIVGLMVGDVSGSSVVASIPTVLLSSGFSRGHEREADAHALDLLERNGIDPAAFARIMRRLGEAHGASDADSGWLSTHPATARRIREAEARSVRFRSGGQDLPGRRD